MKRIIKKILKLKIIQKTLGFLIFLYMHFVYLTSRKEFVFEKNFNKDEFEKNKGVFAFWHGRLALMAFTTNKVQMNVLSSLHPDGRMVAYAMEMFGFKIIDGSSSKKSFSAFRTILKRCAKGESIAITPDGPRGPREKIGKSNIIKVAIKTKLKIYPITFSAKKIIRINSWDNFYFPLPFNTIYFLYADPIIPGADCSEENAEHYKKYLEAKLKNLCYRADHMAGLK